MYKVMLLLLLRRAFLYFKGRCAFLRRAFGSEILILLNLKKLLLKEKSFPQKETRVHVYLCRRTSARIFTAKDEISFRNFSEKIYLRILFRAHCVRCFRMRPVFTSNYSIRFAREIILFLRV